MQKFKKKVAVVKRWGEVERNTHISLKNRYAFFQVSKAASSTAKYYLQKYELSTTPWRRREPIVNSKLCSPHLSPFQVPEDQLSEVFFGDNFKRVTFVRNPYSRLLSCYLHRIKGDENSNSAKLLKNAMNIKTTKEIGFSDFVRFVCSQSPKDMDSHWRVQYDETLAKLVSFDFIGKQETLMSDISSMIALIYGVQPELNNENASPMRTGAKEKLRIYYTEELQIAVAEAYMNDFEYFNYSYDI
ncbi:sulfotransferase family 2 domain-containing protein [Marinobacter zhanjiangensis]|uniref:Sulfotransferase family protein n=1 Tax=Marinobacter zhanjiangensis TaxID=578215 RepID=A0ABQ3B4B5_9GAMM|nr:sulfotransferase family 2 domain-containing protein [Marinobacter zhanjiangensis]GGY76342.1 hypothetical protein GCM10007071_24740 [Marinobacter zhanjiangensis]